MIRAFIILMYFIGVFVTVTVVGSSVLERLQLHPGSYIWAVWVFLTLLLAVTAAAMIPGQK